jgi:hypothetical protein
MALLNLKPYSCSIKKEKMEECKMCGCIVDGNICVECGSEIDLPLLSPIISDVQVVQTSRFFNLRRKPIISKDLIEAINNQIEKMKIDRNKLTKKQVQFILSIL